jgi:hypothetical protein
MQYSSVSSSASSLVLSSHQRKREKKTESGDALWMSIWGCGSPATYCQASVAAVFIHCRSQEWALHSPAGFVYLEFSWMHAPFVFSSIQPYPPVVMLSFFNLGFTRGVAPPLLSSGACHTLAAIGILPLFKHTRGGGSTPAFSGRLVYLLLEWRRAPLPPPVECATLQLLLQTFPSPSTLGELAPHPPSLAGLFIYSSCEGVPLPHSLELREPRPPCYVSFFFPAACLLFSLLFSLFSLCGGQSVQGAMLICARVVCGSSACFLAHLVFCFSQAG